MTDKKIKKPTFAKFVQIVKAYRDTENVVMLTHGERRQAIEAMKHWRDIVDYNLKLLEGK